MTDPLPEQIKLHPFLRKFWNDIYRKNKGVCLLHVGQVGSGKSWAALRLCEWMDPTFNVDRICNTTKEFLTVVSELKPGQAIVFDEVAGSTDAAGARDALTTTNKVLGYFLTKARAKRLFMIYCAPSKFQMDKTVRQIGTTAVLDFKSVDRKRKMSKCRMYWVMLSGLTGESYTVFPRLRQPDGTVTKITRVWVPKPSDELIKAYEKKKLSFIDSDTKEMLNKLEGKTKSKKESVSGIMHRVYSDARNDSETKGFVLNDYQNSVSRIMMKFNCAEQVAKKVRKLLKEDLTKKRKKQ